VCEATIVNRWPDVKASRSCLPILLLFHGNSMGLAILLTVHMKRLARGLHTITMKLQRGREGDKNMVSDGVVKEV
jgi:hypothetical protein